MSENKQDAPQKQRLDKWLWQARFFKTRSLSTKEVAAGHVRVNSERVTKAASQIKTGDVLTFAQARQIKVVRILELSTRRGPATEAQTLYDDLSPAPEPIAPRVGKRPTKKDRREIDKSQGLGNWDEGEF